MASSSTEPILFNEITNSPDSSRLSFVYQPKPLRRTKSFHFSPKTNSSDSPISETDSIYNAQRVSSNENLPPRSEAQQRHGLTVSTEALSPLSIPSPVRDNEENSEQSYSRLPPRTLDSITERASKSTMRRSISLADVNTTSRQQSLVLRAHTPIVFNTGPGSGNPTRGRQIRVSHCRSSSLNALDCFIPKHLSRSPTSSSPPTSSPSTCINIKYPLLPREPPPVRVATPPGLASFSTREAQEYRLTAASPPGRVGTLLGRWFSRSQDEDHEAALNVAISERSLGSEPDREHNRSPPMDMFKRILGISRVVNNVVVPELNPRIGLPPGLRVASTPGILVQAEDGTAVRGRFSGRASGHGVGTRPLDNHPFLRDERYGTIEEMVRDIDKACRQGEADTANQTLQSQSPENPNIERHGSVTIAATPQVSRPASTRAARTAQILEAQRRENQALRDALAAIRSRRLNTASPVSSNRAISIASPPPRSIRVAQIRREHSEMSQNPAAPLSPRVASRPRMIEPPPYARLSPSHSSLDNVAGFQDFIARSEREHARQQQYEKEHKQDRCTVC